MHENFFACENFNIDNFGVWCDGAVKYFCFLEAKALVSTRLHGRFNLFLSATHRNVSMGACAFWTRIGGVLAPQILLLVSMDIFSPHFFYFNQFAFVSSILCLILHKTGTRKDLVHVSLAFSIAG